MNAQKRYPRTAVLFTIAALFILMTGLAFFVQDASTSRQSTGDRPAMVVSDLRLTYDERTNLLTSFVEVKYGGSPVPGATVYARMYMTNPSGTSRILNGRTDQRGQYSTTMPASGPGYYYFLVSHVQRAGMEFDRQGGVRLSAMVQVGPAEDDSRPTATEVPPTATEASPTATETLPTATEASPTATEIPPTATEASPTETPQPPSPPPPPPQGSTSTWHAPTDHEHGDAPPQWVTNWSMDQFGHGVIYGGDETSGPAENSMKHQAFKGYSMTNAVGTQFYLRYHAASNPMDRSARFHSYELYVLDTSGNVSFFQGLYDTGSPEPYPAGDRVPRTNPGDTGQRPIILVVDQASYDGGVRCEQWYMFGLGQWSPEFAVTICGSTTIYVPGENAMAHDPSTWVPSPDGTTGLHRRAEAFWFPGRSHPDGWFCTDLASGSVTSTGNANCAGGVPQYVAPTVGNDARPEFGVNRLSVTAERTFPGGGSVQLPN